MCCAGHTCRLVGPAGGSYYTHHSTSDIVAMYHINSCYLRRNWLLAILVRWVAKHPVGLKKEIGCQKIDEPSCKFNSHPAQCNRLGSIASVATTAVMKLHRWVEGFLRSCQRAGAPPVESSVREPG